MKQYKQVSRSVDDLIPYVNNSRTHSEAQITQVASSIKEFGFTNPILIDEDNGVIAGHGRLLASKKLNLDEVPCIVLSGLSEAQRKAYVIADNQLALNSGWDLDKLQIEVEQLTELDFDINLLGFDDDFLDGLLEEEPADGLTDEDSVPEPPETPKTKLGDVWLLGNHRLMCGDSTSIDDVDKLMAGQKAQLLHADPPYGMGKEGDGVANDNLYNEKLDQFQMDWWNTFRLNLVENASAYIWGNAPDLWRLWYGYLSKSEKLTFRNQIIWDKNHGQGMNSDQHRQYATTVECCLFFMVGEQGFNNNADNYWDGWDSIRDYLKKQRDLMAWNNKIVASFFGFHPRMADHWFSQSQWSMPKKEQYQRLQKEANGKAFNKTYDELKQEHDELKQEHDELKQEFYSERAYFNNTHDTMRDVWQFPRVTGSDRHEHATPKPVAMMERVLKSSLPVDGLCLEPFGGSGSTLMGAEKTKRKCFTMELQEFYCDVIIKRWQEFTGKDAVLESTGETYSSIDVQTSGGLDG